MLRYAFLVTLVSICVPGVALAQPAAASQFAETASAPPAADDTDDVLNLQLGGAFNYGNTRSIQAQGGANFLVLRDIHLVQGEAQFTFGSAATRDATSGQWSDFRENSRNILGRIRYDIFVDPEDSFFAVVGLRNDTFAGLDYRLQLQLGYMRNLFRECGRDDHRLWAEAGFDVTVDDRDPDPLPPSGVTGAECRLNGTCLPNIEDQYSIRLYLGYDNHAHDAWTLRTGLEALFDLVDEENVRLNSISELLVRIEENFQAGVRFTFLFDNVPVPGKDTVDTSTVLTMVYSLL